MVLIRIFRDYNHKNLLKKMIVLKTEEGVLTPSEISEYLLFNGVCGKYPRR